LNPNLVNCFVKDNPIPDEPPVIITQSFPYLEARSLLNKEEIKCLYVHWKKLMDCLIRK
jgi:hypothetical protein